MHCLHKILVRVANNDVFPNMFTGLDRENLIAAARSFAEDATESYCGSVYDWRETGTAGRWKDQYPVNVILSKDNVRRFADELRAAVESQYNQIDELLEKISLISADLNELVAMERERPGDIPSYYLMWLAELLCGKYTYDSGFYDTDRYTAKITEKTVKEVLESPNDWALVMFDCHY